MTSMNYLDFNWLSDEFPGYVIRISLILVDQGLIKVAMGINFSMDTCIQYKYPCKNHTAVLILNLICPHIISDTWAPTTFYDEIYVFVRILQGPYVLTNNICLFFQWNALEYESCGILLVDRGSTNFSSGDSYQDHNFLGKSD